MAAVEQCAGAERRGLPAADYAVLSAVVLAGLALRLYKLDAQSAWWDEYLTIRSAGAPDWTLFSAFIRYRGPDHGPLYLIAQYGWTFLAGTSMTALRLLPVLFSVSAIPLAFAVGRMVFGRGAGWLAALLTALSPMHLWFGQAVRPYSILEPLALLSLYGFSRWITHGGRNWLWGSWAANALLILAHPFAIFQVTAQFCFLLMFRRKTWRVLACWAVFHAAVLGVLHLWLLPVRPYLLEPEYDHITPLTLRMATIALAGDDAIRLSSEWTFSLPQWPWVASETRDWLIERGRIVDYGLVLVNLGCIAFWAWKGLRKRSREEVPVYLLLFVCVPVAIMAVLSLGWRPCLETRYTLTSTFGLYVLLGGILTRLNRPVLQGALSAALAGAYAFQLALLVPATTRTDWKGAGAYVRSHASPQDHAFVLGLPPFAYDTYLSNSGPASIPTEAAYSAERLCEKTAQWLRNTPSDGAARHAWAIVEACFVERERLAGYLRDYFASAPAEVTSEEFPGMLGVYVYRIAFPGSYEGRELSEPSPYRPEEEFRPCLAGLDLKGLGPEEEQATLAVLRKTMILPFPAGKNNHADLALMLVEEGHYVIAAASARKSIAEAPDFGYGYLALGTALAANGEIPAGLEAFRTAFKLDPIFVRCYEPYVSALYEKHDMRAAADALRVLEPMGYPSSVIKKLLTPDPSKG